MMNPADYEVAFQIIAVAGDAKSSAMLAIREARAGRFREAEKLLSEADERLHDAHNQQTAMLSSEARGEPVPVNIILVHAQDHLAGAMLVRELAGEFLVLYSRTTAPAAS